jgi:hypothetical protein
MSSKGRCYVCGGEFGKLAMKNHITKAHGMIEAQQECLIVKVEGAYDKNYWLYLDMPKGSTLSSLDNFLRRIWLECCGHMSGFHINHSMKISMEIKIGEIEKKGIGRRIEYLYDYGSTTQLSITIMDEIWRPKQKGVIRLLGRNNPPVFTCQECGKEAVYICPVYECGDDAFFCEDCGEDHEYAEMMLPVTNSPRMGVCGYDGELDRYDFELHQPARNP